MGWLVALVVVVVVAVVVVRSRARPAAGGGAGTAPGVPGGCAYPADPDDPPETPDSSGWPTRNQGFRGAWTTAPDPLAGSDDFVWRSHWVSPTADPDAARAEGRAIIFRLVDNPLVTITGVSGGGVAAADGRSAYSCCDEDGEIVVTVEAGPGAARQGSGGLWAIDVAVGASGHGILTRFEVA